MVTFMFYVVVTFDKGKCMLIVSFFEISHADIGQCHLSSHFGGHVGESIYVSEALHGHLDVVQIQMKTVSPGNECTVYASQTDSTDI